MRFITHRTGLCKKDRQDGIGGGALGPPKPYTSPKGSGVTSRTGGERATNLSQLKEPGTRSLFPLAALPVRQSWQKQTSFPPV